MSSRKQPLAIHPVLFAFFPVLFLYAQNSEIIRLADIVVPLAVIGGLAVGFTLVCGLATRSLEKGAIIATSAIFLVLSYGHFKRAIPEFKITFVESVVGPSFVILAVTILLLGAIAIKTLKTRRDLSSVTRLLNWIGTILITVEILQAGYVLATRESAASADQIQAAQTADAPHRPDIYYIIVDGYARSDILKEIYGYDNSQFITTLRNLGFYVADSSFANYPQTMLSLSSSFNMDYTGNLGKFKRVGSHRYILIEKLRKSRVAEFLGSQGYTIVMFATSCSATDIDADHIMSPQWFDKELPNLIAAMTPLPMLVGGASTSLARHRRRVLYTLDRLPDLSHIASPKFVFAHILSPHAPFAFDAEGNEVQYSDFWTLVDGVTMIKDSSDAEDYRQRYREQTTFITRKLEETLTRLIGSSTGPAPVVIVQSDHGPASGLKWEDWSTSNIRERFAILNAYYLPNLDDSVLYREISPVNSFRLVLNHYFGTDFELLADRHEFSSLKLPFASQFISKHLGQNAYDHLMQQYNGQEPDSVSVGEVSQSLKEGTLFTNNRYRPVTERGLIISLDSTHISSECEISLDWNDEYELHYRLGTTRVATDRVASREGRGGRLRVEKLAVPPAAQQRGFDNILIVPSGGDFVYGFGHIVFR